MPAEEVRQVKRAAPLLEEVIPSVTHESVSVIAVRSTPCCVNRGFRSSAQSAAWATIVMLMALGKSVHDGGRSVDGKQARMPPAVVVVVDGPGGETLEHRICVLRQPKIFAPVPPVRAVVTALARQVAARTVAGISTRVASAVVHSVAAPSRPFPVASSMSRHACGRVSRQLASPRIGEGVGAGEIVAVLEEQRSL